MNKYEALEVKLEAARRSARKNLLPFVLYTNANYIVNWHHKLICTYLDKFVSGEIKRLMIFMPPQHGKEIGDNTPILTPNGFINHGELRIGNYVYDRWGNPIKVLAISDKITSEYEVSFSDGQKIQCHGNHEWVVYDRSNRCERILETKYLLSQKLESGIPGKRGHRYRFQIDSNISIKNEYKEFIVHPYLLGAWLGDGTSISGCITHHKDDIQHIEFIKSLGYSTGKVSIHNTTGVYRTCFLGLITKLRGLGLYKNKRIPEGYFNGSIDQRLDLLAGLIDTDGYVYHKNGRITFSNTNKNLIEDVRRLVISLGCRVTICKFNPIKSTSGIVGKNAVYQLCFNPNFIIPCKLDRKKIINYNPKIKRRAITSIIKAQNPEMGNCIQVEGGIYLVGRNLIPTHNSELVSRSLPAFLLGENPRNRIIVASYSSDLSSTFNRDCQRIIEKPEYHELFPDTILNSSNLVTVSSGWLRNSDIFQTVDYGGYFRAAGVGGPLTGQSADYAIIDDPVKDRLEASSPTFQLRNWNWFNDVLFTRIHNNTGILLTQTRWDVNDMSGLIIKSMMDGKGEKWVILSLPGIKENDLNPEDPRKIGEALWEERHSITRLEMIQKSNHSTFQSLYQQNPQPTETGGEFYKQFKIFRNVKNYDYDPNIALHISFDFNVNPGMHLGVFQIEGKDIRMIDEILTKSPRNNTQGICREFTRIHQSHRAGLYVYGDPSGNSRDTRSEEGQNDYTIIERELRQFKPIFRVANAAPSVRMRGNFINTIFEFGIDPLRIWIHSKCTGMIEDLTFIKEDSDGTKKKEKAVDIGTGIQYEKWGHYSDLLDYFITSSFKNDYAKYQQGDLTLNPQDIKIVMRGDKFTF